MLLFIECIITCGVFSAIILPMVYKNPINHLMSYPKPIRERVESLPEYQGMLKKTEAKDILRKIIGAVIIMVILALVSYFSGAKTFKTAFWHSFIIFQAVNLFDIIVLDIMIFCNSKKIRIKGTEDMVSDYKNKTHHIIGGIYGLIYGAIVSVISAFLVTLL